MNLPFNDLARLADQLQQQVGQNGFDRRPHLEGGEEPSPKRTRVQGPPMVSMEQQQRQALQAMQNPQGSRLTSGQHNMSPYPEQDQFSPQANGQQQQTAQGKAA